MSISFLCSCCGLQLKAVEVGAQLPVQGFLLRRRRGIPPRQGQRHRTGVSDPHEPGLCCIGAARGLHGSFIGSPRLRRGLRCLRMTGVLLDSSIAPGSLSESVAGAGPTAGSSTTLRLPSEGEASVGMTELWRRVDLCSIAGRRVAAATSAAPPQFIPPVLFLLLGTRRAWLGLLLLPEGLLLPPRLARLSLLRRGGAWLARLAISPARPRPGLA
jgi:hypothetical protein